MLTATNITKSFAGRGVLNGVSAAIAPGEIVALLGPSGSGKTTLLRALALIEPPDSGRITLHDRRWDFPWPKREKRAGPWPKVTVVFQELFLWPHLSLRENILLPARNVGHQNIEAELAEVVEALDLSGFIDRFPNEASLGQRQRIALARAALLKPDYLLLDEVTSALDIEQVHNILTFLPTLKAKGIGMLLITHHINFARRAADQILFLDGGRIVEAGPSHLLDRPQTPRLQQFLSMISAAS